MILEYQFLIWFPAVVLLSTFSTYLITPLINSFGMYFGFVDIPDSRKQHNNPIVRIGGLGIAIGYFLVIFIFLMFEALNKFVPDEVIPFLVLLGCSLGFFFLGFLDDLFKLSPRSRLVAEILISAGAWLGGIRLEVINISWLGYEDKFFIIPKIISLILTLIWLVGVTNAINWIDGLDGLASGITAIASLGFVFTSYSLDQFAAGFLLASLAGSSLGFLFFNKYPAKIFLGDGGSYFLGFNLASLGILGSSSIVEFNQVEQVNTINIHLCIIILLIPLADMTYVIINRLIKKKSPFFADRSHLHYRILNTGLSQKKSVQMIYCFSITLSILAALSTNL